MEYAAAAVEGDEVEPWHLPPAIAGDSEELAPAEAVAEAPRAGFRPIADELRELERTRMKQALDASGGVQTQAAAMLQMPRRTFVAKMKEYGLGRATR
jgi:DNA-binding NtrC family response regulator